MKLLHKCRECGSTNFLRIKTGVVKEGVENTNQKNLTTYVCAKDRKHMLNFWPQDAKAWFEEDEEIKI